MTVAAEIQVRDQLYIGGEWVDPTGTETIEVVNATTEEVMGRIPRARPRTSTAPSPRRARRSRRWSQTSLARARADWLRRSPARSRRARRRSPR